MSHTSMFFRVMSILCYLIAAFLIGIGRWMKEFEWIHETSERPNAIFLLEPMAYLLIAFSATILASVIYRKALEFKEADNKPGFGIALMSSYLLLMFTWPLNGVAFVSILGATFTESVWYELGASFYFYVAAVMMLIGILLGFSPVTSHEETEQERELRAHTAG